MDVKRNVNDYRAAANEMQRESRLLEERPKAFIEESPRKMRRRIEAIERKLRKREHAL